MIFRNLGRRHLFLFVLATAGMLGIVQQSSTTAAAQGPDRVNVLITFASTPGPAEQALVQAAGGQIRHMYHLVPGMAASLPSAAVAGLQNNPSVLAIEPNVRVEAYENDEYSWAWGVARIGGQQVHLGGITGAGVRVAVFDSGLDYTHPDLSPGYAGGWDYVNGDNDPMDDNGHGTHVSGTIGAFADNNGVIGVAPNAQLYGVKILDASGQGDFGNVVAGLEWAVDNGIRVANHSYGSSIDPGTLVSQAFANAAAAGLLNIAAAGNTGNCRGTGNNVGYPARYDDVVAVAAIDLFDGRACFSSTGPAVELSAPGDPILSTYLNGDWAYGSGTSMASPHVTGVAALLFSAGATSATQVRDAMDSTAVDFGASGRDKLYGYGLVDAVAAVAAIAAAGTPDPAVHVSLSMNQATYLPTETEATLTASVTDEGGHPITGLLEGNFTTTLDGVAVVVTFGSTETAGEYTATLTITGLGEGQHAVTVEATAGSESGSDTAAFLVGSAAEPGTVGVQSITYSGQGGRNGDKDMYITATVVDGNGAPVAGATITVLVYIDGAGWAYGSAATNSQGQVTFGARNSPSGTYYTEVWGVSAGSLEWDTLTPPNSYTKQ